jgi:hypothetical protein
LFRPKLLLHGLISITISWHCPFNQEYYEMYAMQVNLLDWNAHKSKLRDFHTKPPASQYTLLSTAWIQKIYTATCLVNRIFNFWSLNMHSSWCCVNFIKYTLFVYSCNYVHATAWNCSCYGRKSLSMFMLLHETVHAMGGKPLSMFMLLHETVHAMGGKPLSMFTLLHETVHAMGRSPCPCSCYCMKLFMLWEEVLVHVHATAWNCSCYGKKSLSMFTPLHETVLTFWDTFLSISDGHTFVYSLLRYRYRYIVSNDRY